MNAVIAVAGKEFRDGMRSRWVLAITVVFALLALGIAYFGAAAGGAVGFVSLDGTIASLASLGIFVIPLIALLISHDAVVGEDERGTLLLLLTYPLSHGQLLLGKFLGHAGILALSTGLGFGVAAAVIALTSDVSGVELIRAFGFFILSATLLGWVFAAIGYMLSVAVAEKARAAGLALLVWFFFVLVFDLGLLGVLVGTGGAVHPEVFPYLLLLNPADVFRLANLGGSEAIQGLSGVAAVARDGFPSGVLLVVLAAWLLAPLGLAGWLFRRREV
ncbi:MAG: ABC transporter permease subunit [Ectothiorhodospiraceae bacterium]|jgi:Cu-processing system permease protein